MNDGGLESVHDGLATSLIFFVDGFGQLGIDGLHELGDALGGVGLTGEVRVVVHKAVGVEDDAVALLIFEQEVVVEFFEGIVFEKPFAIMTLPSDVKDSAGK